MARKIKFDFKPLSGIKVTASEKREILNEIQDFVLESVLSDIGNRKSPVTGRSFRKLSVDYKEFKRAEGLSGVPNLELSGDLLDSLTVKKLKGGNTLRLTVSAKENAKADGHNNFSGKSKLPRRPFIPDEKRDEMLRPSIKRGIKDIIKRFIDDGGES